MKKYLWFILISISISVLVLVILVHQDKLNEMVPWQQAEVKKKIFTFFFKCVLFYLKKQQH